MTHHLLRSILGFISHYYALQVIFVVGGYLFLGNLFMVWHELGHCVGALLVHVKIKKIGIAPKGAYTIRDHGTPRQNLFISACGPLFNIALMILLYLDHHLFLAAMNFILAGSNMLPIKGSDGDRMLTCWHMIKKEKQQCPTHSNSTSLQP